MHYLWLLPIGFVGYRILRWAADAKSLSILKRAKALADAGDPRAKEAWGRMRLTMRELVLRSRKGDKSAQFAVDKLTGAGLLDPDLLKE